MKEKLMEILENPNDKLIAVDLDGTLCLGEFWGEGSPSPLLDKIEYINNLYRKGRHIIIYTARSTEFFTVTYAWLVKHWVKFHWIAMQQKPWADLYICDKSLNIDDVFTKDRLNINKI